MRHDPEDIEVLESAKVQVERAEAIRDPSFAEVVTVAESIYNRSVTILGDLDRIPGRFATETIRDNTILSLKSISEYISDSIDVLTRRGAPPDSSKLSNVLRAFEVVWSTYLGKKEEPQPIAIRFAGGDPDPEEIADLLADLSDLYVAAGGAGIEFRLNGLGVVQEVGEPA